MWDVSGVSGAAPVWSEVMHFLHRGDAGRPPHVPKGVVGRDVNFVDGKGTVKRHEWFLAGTEADRVLARPASLEPKILYPAPGTVIAVDPDIPAELQRIFFRSSAAATLVLDGETLPAGPWQPVPGRHRLSLVGADGGVADEVSFEVR
jgi:penicillin-binding protein 1C